MAAVDGDAHGTDKVRARLAKKKSGQKTMSVAWSSEALSILDEIEKFIAQDSSPFTTVPNPTPRPALASFFNAAQLKSENSPHHPNPADSGSSG